MIAKTAITTAVTFTAICLLPVLIIPSASILNRTYDIRHLLDYTIACQWFKFFFGNNIEQLRALARYRPCPFVDDAMN